MGAMTVARSVDAMGALTVAPTAVLTAVQSVDHSDKMWDLRWGVHSADHLAHAWADQWASNKEGNSAHESVALMLSSLILTGRATMVSCHSKNLFLMTKSLTFYSNTQEC